MNASPAVVETEIALEGGAAGRDSDVVCEPALASALARPRLLAHNRVVVG